MTDHGPSGPELLAPAGSFEAMQAAVRCGADAVYFGTPRFNARQRAANASMESLTEWFSYLHDHNVRGYVTLNTLIFDHEREEVARTIAAVASAGADALIVQDPAVAAMARRIAPDLHLHASTQMTVTSLEGVQEAARMGMQRVVVARELSLEQIRQLADRSPLPLEVFLHGALCLSVSGQCHASGHLLGRSANRGLCGQVCRMAWEGEGGWSPVGPYPLSPGDLFGAPSAGDLAAAGIASLKIEGRMKSPEYVATAVSYLRCILDGGTPPAELTAALGLIFSRGFTGGALSSAAAVELIDGSHPGNRGIPAGVVRRVQRREVVVSPKGDGGARLAAGCGVVFRGTGRDRRGEVGGRIFAVRREGGGVALDFGVGTEVGRVSEGDEVWLTDDPSLERWVRALYARDRVVHPISLAANLSVRPGERPRLLLETAEGVKVEVTGNTAADDARTAPLTRETALAALGKTGGTPYAIDRFTLELPSETPVHCAPGELKELRRAGLAALTKRLRPTPRVMSVGPPDITVHGAHHGAAGLVIVLRRPNQLEALMGLSEEALSLLDALFLEWPGAETDTLELPEGLRQCLGTVFPVVALPGERPPAEGAPSRPHLIRNLGQLVPAEAHHGPRLGDHHLNVTNSDSLAWALDHGLETVMPGLDLRGAALKTFLRDHGAVLELPLFMHVPLMVIRHAFDAPDGARLRSGTGRLEIVASDGGVTLFDAAPAGPLASARGKGRAEREMVPVELAGASVRRFRLEFLGEDPRTVASVVAAAVALVTRGLSGF